MSGYEFVQRAKVLIVRKQYPDAVKVCRLGLLAHPTLVEGRLVLGMALMALERYDEVLAEMRVALELDRASPLGHLLKGEALLRKGDVRQAAEILAKAKELDPLNEKVTSLLEEVRRAKEAAIKSAGRLPPPSSFGDPTETKAYPAHRGAQGDRSLAEPISGAVTVPVEEDEAGVARPRATGAVVPPPEILAVGDRSATIQIDSSDLEEVDGSGQTRAAPPRSGEDFDDDDEPTSAVEISSADIEEVSSPRVRIPAPTATDPGTVRAAPAPELLAASGDEEDDPQPTHEREKRRRQSSEGPSSVEIDLSSGTHRRDPDLDSIERLIEPDDYEGPAAEQDYEEARERSQRIARALSSLPVRASPSPDPPKPVTPEFGGEGPTNPATPGSARRAGRSGRPSAPMAAPKPSPFIDEDELESTSPSPVETRERRPAAPPKRAAPRPAPAPAPAPAPSPWGAPPDPRRGTGVTGPTPTAAVAGLPPPRMRPETTGRTRERPPSVTATPSLRRGPSPLYLAIIAVVVVVAAIGAGLVVRETQFKRAVAKNLREADELAAAQTYRGYLQAEGYYRAILKERKQRDARAALARTRAALAAELGEPVEDARPLVDAVREDQGREASCARVYLALAGDDGIAALRAARETVARFEKDPEAHYLLGRALLAQGDLTAAVEELERSIALGATPLALVALAVAERDRGRIEAAAAQLDRALALVPGHPAAVIEQARLQAASGRLPDGGAHPEAELTELLREGARADADPPPLVSRAQLGWASLALAEVKLARGEEPSARAALAAAAESRPLRDRRFSEALTAALLGVGDVAGARAEAERAAAAWPQDGTPHVWLAKVALTEGKPDVALAELVKAGAAAARPDALAVRGRAKLALGDVDGAARDLDEALSSRPDDRPVALARAVVDLERGDARSAVARSEPLYVARPDPEVGIVYGAALRQTGDRARARQVLETAARSPRGRAAFLELARLDRDEGRYPDARAAYASAIEVAPRAVAPRLEAATLAFDEGDAAGARAALDALVVDAPADADVLLESARVHVATGDLGGAQRFLDEAAKLPAVSRWKLGRERGRLLLARRSPREAVGELKKAAAGAGDDAETRLLLIDAALVLDDTVTTQEALADVLKFFAGRPEAQLAVGRVHLAYGRSHQAVTAFTGAIKALASRFAPPRVMADARTWLGRAEHSQGNLSKARQAFEEAAKGDPSAADPQYYLGLVYYEQDLMPESRGAFERAVTLNPNHADAWFYLGEAARRLGDRGKAREAYRIYLKLAPRGDLASEARRLSR